MSSGKLTLAVTRSLALTSVTLTLTLTKNTPRRKKEHTHTHASISFAPKEPSPPTPRSCPTEPTFFLDLREGTQWPRALLVAAPENLKMKKIKRPPPQKKKKTA